jgi:hypothetical protein
MRRARPRSLSPHNQQALEPGIAVVEFAVSS